MRPGGKIHTSRPSAARRISNTGCLSIAHPLTDRRLRSIRPRGDDPLSANVNIRLPGKGWRKRIGADEMELLLAESLVVAVKTKAVSQRQLEWVTIDTTVQTKAVAHPTDSHLILRAIEWLSRAAKRHGISLRQSFLRLATRARRDIARLLHTGGHKQGLRWSRNMGTWLGRLIRDIRRKIAGDPAPVDRPKHLNPSAGCKSLSINH